MAHSSIRRSKETLLLGFCILYLFFPKINGECRSISLNLVLYRTCCKNLGIDLLVDDYSEAVDFQNSGCTTSLCEGYLENSLEFSSCCLSENGVPALATSSIYCAQPGCAAATCEEEPAVCLFSAVVPCSSTKNQCGLNQGVDLSDPTSKALYDGITAAQCTATALSTAGNENPLRRFDTEMSFLTPDRTAAYTRILRPGDCVSQTLRNTWMNATVYHDDIPLTFFGAGMTVTCKDETATLRIYDSSDCGVSGRETLQVSFEPDQTDCYFVCFNQTASSVSEEKQRFCVCTLPRCFNSTLSGSAQTFESDSAENVSMALLVLGLEGMSYLLWMYYRFYRSKDDPEHLKTRIRQFLLLWYFVEWVWSAILLSVLAKRLDVSGPCLVSNTLWIPYLVALFLSEVLYKGIYRLVVVYMEPSYYVTVPSDIVIFMNSAMFPLITGRECQDGACRSTTDGGECVAGLQQLLLSPTFDEPLLWFLMTALSIPCLVLFLLSRFKYQNLRKIDWYFAWMKYFSGNVCLTCIALPFLLLQGQIVIFSYLLVILGALCALVSAFGLLGTLISYMDNIDFSLALKFAFQSPDFVFWDFSNFNSRVVIGIVVLILGLLKTVLETWKPYKKESANGDEEGTNSKRKKVAANQIAVATV